MSEPTGEGQAAQQVLSMLSPQEAMALNGLPREAMAGILVGGQYSVEAFRLNPLFVQFLHDVVRTFGPDDPELQHAATRQGEGWVYVIDLRTAEGPRGHVPPEDIIGAFEVAEGRILPDSYRANDGHRVFTDRGLVRLPPFLRAAWVRALTPLPPG
jgi:hypothetical protein